MKISSSQWQTFTTLLLLSLLFCIPVNAAQYSVDKIRVLTVKGAIGPATNDYISRSIATAASKAVDLIVIQMDTPGGLDKSMRSIIQAILESDAPVATYVTPHGARAASAGTYILYASHIAAMAPATNLGAATPIQIGAPGMPGTPTKKPIPDSEPPETDNAKPETKTTPSDSLTTLERKQINDAIAYIRGLAERHNRNIEWAEQAVRSAASLTASDALAQNVIDLIAEDLNDLIKQLNGRSINLKGEPMQLVIDTPQVEYLDPDWRNQFLATITDPNVAYILMLIGIYGLILEFYNPGMGVPGIAGAICLLVALYAFQVLPISYAGMGLLLLGIALMIAEAFVPSFGVLGIGGVIAFIFGSVILMDTKLPAFQIALPLIAALGVISLLIIVIIARMLMRTRHQQSVTGASAMLGQLVEVAEYEQGQGKVWLHGELWNAHSKELFKPGDRARIVKVSGLNLEIQAQNSELKEAKEDA